MRRRTLFFTLLILFAASTLEARQTPVVPLEEVIRLALEKNYDISLSRTDAASLAAPYRYSLGAFAPELNASAGRIWNNNNQEQTFTSGEVRERKGIQSNSTTANVQLSWLLFDGFGMFTTRRRLEELMRQGETRVKVQVVNSVAGIINSYYNVVSQKQLLRAFTEQVQINEERVKIAQRRLEVGVGAKPELLQARVDLNARRADVLLLETRIAQFKNELNGLTGMQLQEPYEVSDTIPVNLNLGREELLAELESANPALQLARSNADVAYLAWKERKSDRFPELRFNTAYNYAKNDNKFVINPIAQPLFSVNNGYNYGFTLSLPLLSGFTTRREIQLAEIGYNYNRTLFDQVAMQLKVDAANAFLNYDNARRTLLIEEENIGYARENVFIVFESFRKGVISAVELRIAQQSLAEAYQRLINARYNAKLAETELMRLRGNTP